MNKTTTDNKDKAPAKTIRAKPKLNQQKNSQICALIHVSESEIKLSDPRYKPTWSTDFPRKFNGILWALGLDSKQAYTVQVNIQHRNRLNEVVKCTRWCGNERSDQAWIESGNASRAAVDKSKNNPIVDDIYRQRHETIDAQYTLEQRDRYTVVQED